ncbi:hypothetical protein D3C75_1189060 [compost metagenome]
MNDLSTAELTKEGVSFDIHGFIVGPFTGILIIIIMGLIFFSLCVYKFNKADFSDVKVFNPER